MPRERRAGVVIEQLPFGDLIRRYDGPDVLFCMDPPYVDCERDYGDGFERADFERLADQLGGIAGRFILSINDTPFARDVFGRFAIRKSRRLTRFRRQRLPAGNGSAS